MRACSVIYFFLGLTLISLARRWLGVLLVAAVQSRGDPPANWFSPHIALGISVVRQAMSAKTFFRILGGLHVCDKDKQPLPGAEGYSPGYKVQEFFTALFSRMRELFVPHRTLSLDETLLRSFNRVSFIVRVRLPVL